MVCSGGHTERHSPGASTAGMYFLTDPEDEVRNQGCGSVHLLRASREDADPCLSPWFISGHLSLCVSVSKLPLLTRTPVISGQGPRTASFQLSRPFKGPTAKYNHVLRHRELALQHMNPEGRQFRHLGVIREGWMDGLAGRGVTVCLAAPQGWSARRSLGAPLGHRTATNQASERPGVARPPP